MVLPTVQISWTPWPWVKGSLESFSGVLLEYLSKDDTYKISYDSVVNIYVTYKQQFINIYTSDQAVFKC